MGVVLTVGLIGVGLLLMQQEQAYRQPASRKLGPGPEPAPASNLPAFSELPWKRPFFVAMPLTSEYAVLYMLIGLFGILNFISSLSMSIWLEIVPGPFSFLFLAGGAVMFYLGLQNWQRIQALVTRGQMTQGVVFDRWIIRRRGITYCVAYYFDLPCGSPDGSRVIRAEVNRQVYHAFQTGDTIPVRYLPDKP